jgi:23S rRNA pseudouridine2605 synthase
MDINLELVNSKKSRNSGSGSGNGNGRSKGGNTNTWVCMTYTQGKNRMIRKALYHMGLQATRFIRKSFGDYD